MYLVCKMDENIGQILQPVGIFLSGEPHQTVLEDVKLERLYAGHQDVDANVKLEIINQERVGDVVLDYHLTILLLTGNILCNKISVSISEYDVIICEYLRASCESYQVCEAA